MDWTMPITLTIYTLVLGRALAGLAEAWNAVREDRAAGYSRTVIGLAMGAFVLYAVATTIILLALITRLLDWNYS